MDLEYDRKFEEMKKYIPFLENMIKRLESTNNGVKNPRKAQLDKIRSLRDLLLDKKKRMKMENLLKCEQVLVNLYAKVEQRDSMADSKEDCTEQTQKEKSDLNIVRNKLKSVVSKLQDDVPETLPEIARATNTEVVCTPGSKEPALFQRRPNKASPLRQSPSSYDDENSSNSKRQYTRVLMSPEHKKKEWLVNSDINTDKPLFSRRSPRRSPRRYSPSYKRERKKSSKQRSKSSQQSKDLNITLKVPEESLGSLNTKDILSRIINCSDSDVDIDTLRGLRSQILGELKQTGTKDDISDLILKSYKKKEKRSKKKDEVEEGELSDSESEAIENIYGNLVVVNQGEGNSNNNKICSDKKHPRKIQICLVINSDKEKDSKVNDQITDTALDITDFEVYTENKTVSKSSSTTTRDKIIEESSKIEIDQKDKTISVEEMKSTLKSIEESKSPKKDSTKINKLQNLSEEKTQLPSTEGFKPNFYQSSAQEKINPEENPTKQNLCKSINEDIDGKRNEATSDPVEIVKNKQVPVSSAKVKMKKEVVSEIDILQALKKEILGETATVSMPEEITPLLHQPKIMKVASAQEIVSKKRISIEKYKQKSAPSIKQSLFNPITQQPLLKDENWKKQSLKLTEKECERFNFPVNVSPVDSSEDEDKQRWDFEFLHGAPQSPELPNREKSPMDFEFLHGDSVPKSPDHEDFADAGIKPPVIIPSDPVKNIVPNAKVDIDMRTLIPLVSPVTIDGSKKSIISPSLTTDKMLEATWNDKANSSEKIRNSLPELLMRTESNESTAKNSPNSYIIDSDRVSRPSTSFANVPPSKPSNIPSLMSLNLSTHMTQTQNPNIISKINTMMTPILNSNIPLILNPNMAPTMTPGLMPNMNPSMTPSRMISGMNPMMTPILTPNARSYEMTPRPNFDVDDYTKKKHVYAPIFPTFEPHDFMDKDNLQVNQTNENTKWEDRNLRSTSVQRDVDYNRNRNDRYMGDTRLDSPQIRMECPSTPNPSFGRMECPSTPNPSFGRMECPPTPNSSFGRMDCSSTPNPSFGRMECPPTPNPSFGRMECPLTPNPSFGRMETPMTPVHSFGRSDCPMTPSHSFGRSDSIMTSNIYGRSDYHHQSTSFSRKYMKSQDPRLNRTSEYDKCQSRNDERNRSYFEDDHMTDSANRFRNLGKSCEQDSRNRERISRRELSVGRSFSREYETDNLHSKDYYKNDYQYRTEKYKCTDDEYNIRNYRARSVGRLNPSEDTISAHRERSVTRKHTREGSIEKPISVQSHTGRSFNIDTSFNRTFQESKSTSNNTSFDTRRQRASSVGRSLRGSCREDFNQPSANKNKSELVNMSDRKSMQFRRACSVGRELKDYNANKNFKDIKDDLRSCKFNNYNFNIRDPDHKNKSSISYSNEYLGSRNTRTSNTAFIKSTGNHINRDPRRGVRDYDSKMTKTDDSSKYSPRKNFRDPRMRRETDVKNTIKDKYKDKYRSSSCSRYKNRGIVYSNDNIAKGTILASAAGVKNFKIPKIKRAVEEKEAEINDQSETEGKNEMAFKNVRKNVNAINVQSKKVASKQIETNISDKGHMKTIAKDIAMKVDRSKSKEDLTLLNKMPDTVKSHDKNTDSVNSISDNCERRITRSAIKGGTPCKQISRALPAKKLRRIKKPLVYDSDSDSQENVSSIEKAEKDLDGDKNNQSTEISENDLDKEGKIKSCSNTRQDNKSEHIESREFTNEKDTNNRINEKEISASVTPNESCEGHSDSLDINFGVDDDLFSDNIASGSVLDNINALIADLDQDIEAPKINDFNDKFINNIVGTISANDSSVPLYGDQTDFASDVTFNDKLGFVVDVQNPVKSTNTHIAFSRGYKNIYEVTKVKRNPEHVNVSTPSDQILVVQNSSKEIINNEAKDSGPSITESNDKTVVQEEFIKITGEVQETSKKLNTDAIVSTTAHDEKTDDIPQASQCSTNNNVSSVYPLAPDSTINSNENINLNDKDLQESVPDSTNELASEMNISSSGNSNDMSFKEQSVANSTCADNFPRIDSIGKLLSMLEDKNKIKELLTLLSKDSGENEKIKKKLEKLSEIVSDDEEDRVFNNDTNKQKNTMFITQNHEKAKDIVAEQLKNDDNNGPIDNNKCDKESGEEKSVMQKTVLTDNELQYNSEGVENNEVNEKNKKLHSLDTKEQEIINIGKKIQEYKLFIDSDEKVENRVEEKNISLDMVKKATDSNIDAESKDEEIVENVEVLREIEKDTVQNKQILAEYVKENELTSTNAVKIKTGNKITRKSKITKRGRSKLAKQLALNKDKRITRSEAGVSQSQIPPVPKKPSRELLKLQEDIRDMFISEDILNATGIRMCRLAKLVDDKNLKGDTPPTEVEPEPIVVLENIKNKMAPAETYNSTEKYNKKKASKSKHNTHYETSIDSESKGKLNYKPGPKSKTKRHDDPYIFETESIGESKNTVDSRYQNTDSDSDSVSTKSLESSELLVELKKKTKRKRSSWKLGVIKKKGVKPKSVGKNTEFSVADTEEVGAHETKDMNTHEIPDFNCFTDKSYCFDKNVKTYLCRLCGYRGNDIVPHYKKHHPHSEIPLSRLSPGTAKEAIEQCENMNLQAISKIQTMKYVCRFCFQEFHKQNTALETFFWHVVSVHTGEYKHLCSECTNVTRCPFHLDIPPPPKNLKGQLIGYICGRCNFTQVSLENLKTHVIIRHDDEQTEVYSINLGEIPRKLLQSLITKVSETSIEGPRVLRSTRSNQSIAEPSDDHSDITDSSSLVVGLDIGRDNLIQEINTQVAPKTVAKDKIQSKLIFENDDMSDTSSYSKNDEIIKASIKLERDEDTQNTYNNDAVEKLQELAKEPALEPQPPPVDNDKNADMQTELTQISDVLDYPHFKIKLTGSGTKEYICCINGKDNHYKTTLLISFKKHVQLKHSENWDGYCFVCKVIVTAQGKHNFKDCLQHFLDKHIDNFPIFQEISEPIVTDVPDMATSTSIKDASISKTYINVRPLSELISTEQSATQEVNPSMPKIQSVVSLGVSDNPLNSESQKHEKVYNYEEAQTEVINKKHRVVLEAMLSHEKLIQVFKCAGRFCSYTTDNAEEALLHASTHQRIGGECALKCTYCDFDSSGNAIDLVMHVFKNYKHCAYACSKCFYRAAASQLVYAHIKRVHTEFNADKVSVLSSATVLRDNTTDDLMTRDEAVLYYVCNNRDPEEGGICQFKSYVLTKFREHLQTRHANDPEYSCYMCNKSMSSSKLLAQHLKSHGLRIYQCCRCLFGADNESELMAHASQKHPVKQPKAYLRIITSKGGSSEVRVLPLAVLSKSTVETIVVTPNIDKESPVKQAERSLDLEKLIGQTNLMIESMNTITNAAAIEPANLSINENQIQLENEETSCSIPQVEPGRSSPPVILSLLVDPQNTFSKSNTIVKSEPVETGNKASDIPPLTSSSNVPEPDVVCLDSDEETSLQNVIDLSGEDPLVELNSNKKQENTDIKIPRSRLYKCSKCFLLSKSEGMFKRHILSCFPNPIELVKCAFCSYTTTANKIVVHYNNNHLETSLPYTCAICNGKFGSLAVARKHMKVTHNEFSTIVNSKMSSTGVLQYVLDTDFKERQTPKRKLSGETGNKNSEPAPKLKKYGPQDVEKLPINPILDDLVYCSLCEFSTKVRLNMVRHLQLHAEQQPVPRTAPVNPVPHLESNEKHFDKMVNLASSSITSSNKTSKDGTTAMVEYLSPEAAAIYPKYVPDKHRYTCGAKGCSYISVNESMFKIHWETLHAGTNDYHCVHCPPHQHLDTTKPLTAMRIIAHLKMHDIKLYACSSCTFYHYTRKVIDKHLKEVHNGKMIIVREDGATLPSNPLASTQSSTAPTMDLKPWQCGLCKFKSMIRPEVIEHCGKFHQSKMQFKCTYCGFRTSNIENISKHQSKQHPGKKEDVFYFYYREGSIPDEADGTACWQKQSQKNESEIKIEIDIPVAELVPKPVRAKPPNLINLDIVKKEVDELQTIIQTEESIEDLCSAFGQFCDPNGLKYKCPLCKVIIEDTKEAMQSHLYEELQYRKWGCAVCSYKAFHKPGLQQHVQTEHGNREAREPIELQVDYRIEMWVSKLLEHQTAIIERNKENLAKQKAEILRANPGSSVKVAEKLVEPTTTVASKPTISMAELEKLFGPFGVPSNMNYTCPKCNISAKSEAVMQEHLEGELNKIRWFCNVCCETFHTYHDAQFHCRSIHPGQSSRPVEATRDVSLRAAWVTSVLRVQKLSMNYMPVIETIASETITSETITSETITSETITSETLTPTADSSLENSLLVVRYEEKVPTPEEQMKRNKKSGTDEDKLTTDESEKKKPAEYQCQYCSASYKYESFFQGHVLKHYGLKPITCLYCPHTDYKRAMDSHIKNQHPNRSIVYLNTPIPTNPPVHDYLKNTPTTTKPVVIDVEPVIVCLGCEEAMTRAESLTHYHDNVRPQFGIKGSIVYRCWTCLTLHKTSNDFNLHHKQFHANEKKNSSFYKLSDENRCLFCSVCNKNFGNITQYRSHQQIKHGLKSLSNVELSVSDVVIELDDEIEVGKRKAEDITILPVPKRVAKKSTTKLPNVKAVARKSTTKLPFDAPCYDKEFSYYGTKPSMDNLENVTTLMPFYNTFVPFTLEKLSEFIKIYPVVVVKDVYNKQ